MILHNRSVFLALALALDGCSSRALDHCDEPDLAVVPDFAVLPDLATDMTRPKPPPCPAGSRFIFTIDNDRTLSRFNPVTLQFFDVPGKIMCPSMATPNSMAIARDGTGWVNYSSGELFHLDTTTLACTATPYPAGQGGLINFGMSFAQNAPGSVAETLFVTDVPPMTIGKLGTIDLKLFQLATEIDLSDTSHAELTGDGFANLWGFFPEAVPPRIDRIDKKTGVLDREIQLPSLSGTPRMYAFAAWSSDFYIFLERQGIDTSTKIYRVSAVDGSITTVVANTGRHIPGVGVATCAGD